MKTKSKTTSYIVHSISAAVLLLTAQVSLAGSATWLSSPQDSAWENADNWTAGGPPNGPSDTATFAQSSHRDVNISTSEEVNSIVFTSGSFSFFIFGGQLLISGEGINNNNISQFFDAGGQMIFNHTSTAGSATITNESLVPGQTIFNDTSTAANASIVNAAGDFDPRSGQTTFNGASTADHASIANEGGFGSHATSGGQTTFNGTSTAANASIHNVGTTNSGTGGQTVFNDTSTAAHATITNDGDFFAGGTAIFNGSSTADSAIITANGTDEGGGGAILFNGASTGGTARVRVFDNGYLDISGHRSGVTIGSVEGSGNVFLGANRLRVGTNDINTSFSGMISNDGQGSSLTKVGSGILSLQTNHCIADTVGLILVSGSVIKLDFTGPPDVIASLKVNGVSQPPGIYGGPMSGAPHILLEFRGSGTVSVGPLSTLGNISARAFVQTGDNVMIGGFMVQGTEPKRVIIRAIGPELTQYGVPNALG